MWVRPPPPAPGFVLHFVTNYARASHTEATCPGVVEDEAGSRAHLSTPEAGRELRPGKPYKGGLSRRMILNCRNDQATR